MRSHGTFGLNCRLAEARLKHIAPYPSVRLLVIVHLLADVALLAAASRAAASGNTYATGWPGLILAQLVLALGRTAASGPTCRQR
jgi:hypothetical protein